MTAQQRPSASGLRRPASGITLEAGKLMRLRNEKSLSREDLALLSGISVSMLTKIENSERKPRAVTLASLCEALSCKPVDLLPDRIHFSWQQEHEDNGESSEH